MSIAGLIQGADLGNEITLFKIDLSDFGLGEILIAPCAMNEFGSVISFGGEPYSPHPLQSSGFEVTSQGSLPRPSLTVANVDNSFTALVEQNDDLHGAVVTRIRTFERYLDDGEEPDGGSYLPPDIYEIAQKTEHTSALISWELSAQIDQQNVTLPGRKATRDWCGWQTRRWDAVAGAFDYTNVECPYTGDPKDVNGNPCAPADEVFSKRLGTCCQARFGTTAQLPTGAFPGLSRISQQ